MFFSSSRRLNAAISSVRNAMWPRLQRIDNVVGAEADAEVRGRQMHLRLPVGHEGDRGGVALRDIACAIQ